MILIRLRDHRFTITTQPFLSGNMEQADSFENIVNFVGFGVSVDSLLLPGFETVQIAEVLFRTKKRNLLHLLVGEADERTNVLTIHRSYCN